MTVRAPFEPKRGANQSVTASGTSASISIDPVAKSVRICNVNTTNVAHIRVGQGSQTASAADLPVLPLSCVIVSKGDGEDTLAYFSSAGAALFVQTGEGGV